MKQILIDYFKDTTNSLSHAKSETKSRANLITVLEKTNFEYIENKKELESLIGFGECVGFVGHTCYYGVEFKNYNLLFQARSIVLEFYYMFQYYRGRYAFSPVQRKTIEEDMIDSSLLIELEQSKETEKNRLFITFGLQKRNPKQKHWEQFEQLPQFEALPKMTMEKAKIYVVELFEKECFSLGTVAYKFVFEGFCIVDLQVYNISGLSPKSGLRLCTQREDDIYYDMNTKEILKGTDSRYTKFKRTSKLVTTLANGI